MCNFYCEFLGEMQRAPLDVYDIGLYQMPAWKRKHRLSRPYKHHPQAKALRKGKKCKSGKI
jgi:hypothetical protein